MTDKRKLKLGFYYKDDDYDNEVKTVMTVPVVEDITPEINVIGDAFNNFLAQVGYIRRDCILMESLTVDEYEFLHDCLAEYRETRGV